MKSLWLWGGNQISRATLRVLFPELAGRGRTRETDCSDFPDRGGGAHGNEQWAPPALSGTTCLDSGPELPFDMVHQALGTGKRRHLLEQAWSRQVVSLSTKPYMNWVTSGKPVLKEGLEPVRACWDLVHGQMDNYVANKSLKCFLIEKEKRTITIIFNPFLQAHFYHLFRVKRRIKSWILLPV